MKRNVKLLSTFLSILLLLFTLIGCGEYVNVDFSDSENGITSERTDSYISLDSEVDTSDDSVFTEDVSSTDNSFDDTTNETTVSEEESQPTIDENGTYTSVDDVAFYIHTYGKLPKNFITKNEARKLGWEGGGLEDFAPGKCIGGDKFGNYEGLLPKANGRYYTECDIDTLGKKSRGVKRIVFSNDGLIYYTDDHYESFKLLYGEE